MTGPALDAMKLNKGMILTPPQRIKFSSIKFGLTLGQAWASVHHGDGGGIPQDGGWFVMAAVATPGQALEPPVTSVAGACSYMTRPWSDYFVGGRTGA